ncbi:RHS Repeat protein [Paecilomyces variotii No. 5]|uniref:RHS Repeat protein n=1 Tax=Byssochlamys spectabilis (strain No. 5 / NBRC 109023) TaxID=1356009 RepID=V5FQN4_BYSSN|nr:RHS Repeat protein [Paecilomyces variotii No. 5]
MANATALPVGTFDVDGNGIARYSFTINVPQGITSTSTPQISLEYCQGAPNANLGTGWSLGGLSTIRRQVAGLALNSLNAQKDYDRTVPRLALDGNELLLIQGDHYDSPDGVYKKEIDSHGETVYATPSGFTVRDTLGARKEYEAIASSDPSAGPSEWRIRKQIDRYGNFIEYNYDSLPGDNSSYLTSVIYTSNERTSLTGTRLILFEHVPREDLVVHTSYGHKVTSVYRLARIRVAMGSIDQFAVVRSYEMEYTYSPSTGSSLLQSITEVTGTGTRLIPTLFEYTISSEQEQTFSSHESTTLAETTNNVTLLTLNVSGRSLGDLGCVRYDSDTGNFTIKTYLAQYRRSIEEDQPPTIEWSPSEGPGSEAALPPTAMGKTTPTFLSGDLNGDGLTDLIVPFEDTNGNLCFSISSSTGSGYEHYTLKPTDCGWHPDSRFLSLDLTGNGCTDILQIYPHAEKLHFRVFSAINEGGQTTLANPTETKTTFDFSHTVDWLQMATHRDGSHSLVRVWADDKGMGVNHLRATTFTLQSKSIDASQGILIPSSDASLGMFEIDQTPGVTVLPCDINGDGVQDLVVSLVETEDMGTKTVIRMAFTTFLNDGAGGFSQQGEPQVHSHVTEPGCAPSGMGKMYVTDLRGTNYPSIAYVYQELHSNNYVSLISQGSSSGLVRPPKWYHIADQRQLPIGRLELLPADLNGSSLADWLFYSIVNDEVIVHPIYNTGKVCEDFLSSVRNPMGLSTSFTYAPMTNTDIYEPTSRLSPSNISAKRGAYVVKGTPSYVIAEINSVNDPSINSIPYHDVVQKRYYGARVNPRSYGWEGFSRISSYDPLAGNTKIDHYQQSWPFTGCKWKTDEIQGHEHDGMLFQSTQITYEERSQDLGGKKIYRLNKSAEVHTLMDNDLPARSFGHTYEYDPEGNVLLECSKELDEHALWTRYDYTTIGPSAGLPVSKKVSTKRSNTDMHSFEEGDLSLSLFEYDSEHGTVCTAREWLSDHSCFAQQNFEYDTYGNEIFNKQPSGLETRTEYDSVFHCYPVKIHETGPGVDHVRLSGYDARFGHEVACRERNGAIKINEFDGYGRLVHSANAGDQTNSQKPAQAMLPSTHFISESELTSLVLSAQVCPNQSSRYDRLQTPNSQYLRTTTIIHFQEGIEGQDTREEVVDCTGRVCKQREQHGTFLPVWKHFEYDPHGYLTAQSLPQQRPNNGSSDWDWTPALDQQIQCQYDCLKRPVSITKPCHRQNDNATVITRNVYRKGGSHVEHTVERIPGSIENGQLTVSTVLSRTESFFTHIGGEEKLSAKINEKGERTGFTYDALGRLVAATDAAGKTETRTYNTTGKIVETYDAYQNSVIRTYSPSGDLVGERNSMDEHVTHDYDAKGRRIKSIAANGRQVLYEYDGGCSDGLSRVALATSYDSPINDATWEYHYDFQGRLARSILCTGRDEIFSVDLSYDWQGQLTSRNFFDGSSLKIDHQGNRVGRISFSGEDWNVEAEMQSYNAFEKPEQWSIHGSGVKNFQGTMQADQVGFPLLNSLRNPDMSLVENHFIYNDLDQLSRLHEFISGKTADYTYEGGRLVSSNGQTGPLIQYAYDLSGNIIQKGATVLHHGPRWVEGTEGDQSIVKIQYDEAGRMISRELPQQSKAHSFSYDGFGNIATITDATKGNTSHILSDGQGNTLVRTLADGSREIQFTRELSVLIRPDQSRQIRRRMFGADKRLLATITTEEPLEKEAKPTHITRVAFTDAKGNVTHLFGGDGKLCHNMEYDDFGSLSPSDAPLASTYEANAFDTDTYLIDFGARWYDPLVGRFASPDDILDEKSLSGVDGVNRYAFENNDPINHVDPTGHWGTSFWGGLLLGLTLLAVGVAIAATGGAGIGLAALSGALISGGLAAVQYSWENRDEKDAGKFWAGYGATVAVSFITGAASGAFGYYISSSASLTTSCSRLFARGAVEAINKPGKILATFIIVASKALVSGFAGAVVQMGQNLIQRDIYGAKVGLWDGVGSAGLTGLRNGALFAVGTSYWTWKGQDQLNRVTATVKGTFEYDCVNPNVFNEEFDHVFKVFGYGNPVGQNVSGQVGKSFANVNWETPFGR